MAKKSSLSLKPSTPRSKKAELQSRIEAFEASGEPVAPKLRKQGTLTAVPKLEDATEDTPQETTTTSSTSLPSTIYQRAKGGQKDYRSTIYFPVELHELLKSYCSAERTSISTLVTQIVQKHLEEIGPVDDVNAFMAAYYNSKSN